MYIYSETLTKDSRDNRLYIVNEQSKQYWTQIACGTRERSNHSFKHQELDFHNNTNKRLIINSFKRS